MPTGQQWGLAIRLNAKALQSLSSGATALEKAADAMARAGKVANSVVDSTGQSLRDQVNQIGERITALQSELQAVKGQTAIGGHKSSVGMVHSGPASPALGGSGTGGGGGSPSGFSVANGPAWKAFREQFGISHGTWEYLSGNRRAGGRLAPGSLRLPQGESGSYSNYQMLTILAVTKVTLPLLRSLDRIHNAILNAQANLNLSGTPTESPDPRVSGLQGLNYRSLSSQTTRPGRGTAAPPLQVAPPVAPEQWASRRATGFTRLAIEGLKFSSSDRGEFLADPRQYIEQLVAKHLSPVLPKGTREDVLPRIVEQLSGGKRLSDENLPQTYIGLQALKKMASGGPQGSLARYLQAEHEKSFGKTPRATYASGMANQLVNYTMGDYGEGSTSEGGAGVLRQIGQVLDNTITARRDFSIAWEQIQKFWKNLDKAKLHAPHPFEIGLPQLPSLPVYSREQKGSTGGVQTLRGEGALQKAQEMSDEQEVRQRTHVETATSKQYLELLQLSEEKARRVAQREKQVRGLQEQEKPKGVEGLSYASPTERLQQMTTGVLAKRLIPYSTEDVSEEQFAQQARKALHGNKITQALQNLLEKQELEEKDIDQFFAGLFKPQGPERLSPFKHLLRATATVTGQSPQELSTTLSQGVEKGPGQYRELTDRLLNYISALQHLAVSDLTPEVQGKKRGKKTEVAAPSETIDDSSAQQVSLEAQWSRPGAYEASQRFLAWESEMGAKAMAAGQMTPFRNKPLQTGQLNLQDWLKQNIHLWTQQARSLGGEFADMPEEQLAQKILSTAEKRMGPHFRGMATQWPREDLGQKPALDAELHAPAEPAILDASLTAAFKQAGDGLHQLNPLLQKLVGLLEQQVNLQLRGGIRQYSKESYSSADIKSLLGLGGGSLAKLVKEGQLDAPLRTPAGQKRWSQGHVDQLMAVLSQGRTNYRPPKGFGGTKAQMGWTNIHDLPAYGIESMSLSTEELKRRIYVGRALGIEQQLHGQTLPGKIERAAGNIVAYGGTGMLAYGAVNQMQQGFGTAIEFEKVMTDIRKVMNPFGADLNKLGQSAMDMGETFGRSILEVGKAMEFFAAQGQGVAEITRETQTAVLAANVTDLSVAEATEALTAAHRQFGIASTESMRILDSWNEVENVTAVNTRVLTDALKRAGTSARVAGLDFDQFNGVVAAIGEATRNSGDMIGTAMRYMFQHLRSPEALKALQDIGIYAQDIEGNFRPAGEVITQLSRKWGQLADSQRQNVAESIGGTRHLNDFFVMMQTWPRATDIAITSLMSQGSAMRENEIAMQSTAKQIEQLKAAYQGLWAEVGKAGALEMLKKLTEALKAMINVAQMLNKGLGGVPLGALGIGSLLGVGVGTAAFMSGGLIPGIGGLIQGPQTQVPDIKQRILARSTGNVQAGLSAPPFWMMPGGVPGGGPNIGGWLRSRAMPAAMLGANWYMQSQWQEHARAQRPDNMPTWGDSIMGFANTAISAGGIAGLIKGGASWKNMGKMSKGMLILTAAAAAMDMLGQLGVFQKINTKRTPAQQKVDEVRSTMERLSDAQNNIDEFVLTGRGTGEMDLGKFQTIKNAYAALSPGEVQYDAQGNIQLDAAKIDRTILEGSFKAARQLQGTRTDEWLRNLLTDKAGNQDASQLQNLKLQRMQLSPSANLKQRTELETGINEAEGRQIARYLPAIQARALSGGQNATGLGAITPAYLREVGNRTGLDPNRLASLAIQKYLSVGGSTVNVDKNLEGTGKTPLDALQEAYGQFEENGPIFRLVDHQVVADGEKQVKEFVARAQAQGDILFKAWDTKFGKAFVIAPTTKFTELIKQYSQVVEELSGRNEQLLRSVEQVNRAFESTALPHANYAASPDALAAVQRRSQALSYIEEHGKVALPPIRNLGGPNPLQNLIHQLTGALTGAAAQSPNISLGSQVELQKRTIDLWRQLDQQIQTNFEVIAKNGLPTYDRRQDGEEGPALNPVLQQLKEALGNPEIEAQIKYALNKRGELLAKPNASESDRKLADEYYQQARNTFLGGLKNSLIMKSAEANNATFSKNVGAYSANAASAIPALGANYSRLYAAGIYRSPQDYLQNNPEARKTVEGLAKNLDDARRAAAEYSRVIDDAARQSGYSADDPLMRILRQPAEEMKATVESLGGQFENLAQHVDMFDVGMRRMQQQMELMRSKSGLGPSYGQTGLNAEGFAIHSLQSEIRKLVQQRGQTDNKDEQARLDMQIANLAESLEARKLSSAQLQQERQASQEGLVPSVMSASLARRFGMPGGAGADTFLQHQQAIFAERMQNVIKAVLPSLKDQSPATIREAVNRISGQMGEYGGRIRELSILMNSEYQRNYTLANPSSRAMADTVREMIGQGATSEEIFSDPYMRLAAQNEPLLGNLLDQAIQSDLDMKSLEAAQELVKLSGDTAGWVKNIYDVIKGMGLNVGSYDSFRQQVVPATQPALSSRVGSSNLEGRSYRGRTAVDSRGRIAADGVPVIAHKGEMILNADQSQAIEDIMGTLDRNQFAVGTLNSVARGVKFDRTFQRLAESKFGPGQWNDQYLSGSFARFYPWNAQGGIKLTTDPDDVEAFARLYGRNFSGAARPHFMAQVGEVARPQGIVPVTAMLMERLQNANSFNRQQVFNFTNAAGALRQIREANRRGLLNVGKATDLPVPFSHMGSLPELVNQALGKIKPEARMAGDAEMVASMLQQLMPLENKFGVYPLDLHGGNWGLRGNQPALLDLGMSKFGPGPQHGPIPQWSTLRQELEEPVTASMGLSNWWSRLKNQALTASQTGNPDLVAGANGTYLDALQQAKQEGMIDFMRKVYGPESADWQPTRLWDADTRGPSPEARDLLSKAKKQLRQRVIDTGGDVHVFDRLLNTLKMDIGPTSPNSLAEITYPKFKRSPKDVQKAWLHQENQARLLFSGVIGRTPEQQVNALTSAIEHELGHAKDAVWRKDVWGKSWSLFSTETKTLQQRLQGQLFKMILDRRDPLMRTALLNTLGSPSYTGISQNFEKVLSGYVFRPESPHLQFVHSSQGGAFISEVMSYYRQLLAADGRKGLPEFEKLEKMLSTAAADRDMLLSRPPKMVGNKKTNYPTLQEIEVQRTGQLKPISQMLESAYQEGLTRDPLWAEAFEAEAAPAAAPAPAAKVAPTAPTSPSWAYRSGAALRRGGLGTQQWLRRLGGRAMGLTRLPRQMLAGVGIAGLEGIERLDAAFKAGAARQAYYRDYTGSALIDTSYTNAPLGSQLGLKRNGHFYRGVTGEAALQDFLQSGLVRNEQGQGAFWGEEAYKRYALRGKEPGYIYEAQIPESQVNRPFAGGPSVPGAKRYVKTSGPLSASHVTRIWQVQQPGRSGAQSRVNYRLVYDPMQNLWGPDQKIGGFWNTLLKDASPYSQVGRWGSKLSQGIENTWEAFGGNRIERFFDLNAHLERGLAGGRNLLGRGWQAAGQGWQGLKGGVSTLAGLLEQTENAGQPWSTFKHPTVGYPSIPVKASARWVNQKLEAGVRALTTDRLLMGAGRLGKSLATGSALENLIQYSGAGKLAGGIEAGLGRLGATAPMQWLGGSRLGRLGKSILPGPAQGFWGMMAFNTLGGMGARALGMGNAWDNYIEPTTGFYYNSMFKTMLAQGSDLGLGALGNLASAKGVSLAAKSGILGKLGGMGMDWGGKGLAGLGKGVSAFGRVAGKPLAILTLLSDATTMAKGMNQIGLTSGINWLESLAGVKQYSQAQNAASLEALGQRAEAPLRNIMRLGTNGFNWAMGHGWDSDLQKVQDQIDAADAALDKASGGQFFWGMGNQAGQGILRNERFGNLSEKLNAIQKGLQTPLLIWAGDELAQQVDALRKSEPGAADVAEDKWLKTSPQWLSDKLAPLYANGTPDPAAVRRTLYEAALEQLQPMQEGLLEAQAQGTITPPMTEALHTVQARIAAYYQRLAETRAFTTNRREWGESVTGTAGLSPDDFYRLAHALPEDVTRPLLGVGARKALEIFQQLGEEKPNEDAVKAWGLAAQKMPVDATVYDLVSVVPLRNIKNAQQFREQLRNEFWSVMDGQQKPNNALIHTFYDQGLALKTGQTMDRRQTGVLDQNFEDLDRLIAQFLQGQGEPTIKRHAGGPGNPLGETTAYEGEWFTPGLDKNELLNFKELLRQMSDPNLDPVTLDARQFQEAQGSTESMNGRVEHSGGVTLSADGSLVQLLEQVKALLQQNSQKSGLSVGSKIPQWFDR